jgi:hypothetical protein
MLDFGRNSEGGDGVTKGESSHEVEGVGVAVLDCLE